MLSYSAIEVLSGEIQLLLGWPGAIHYLVEVKVIRELGPGLVWIVVIQIWAKSRRVRVLLGCLLHLNKLAIIIHFALKVAGRVEDHRILQVILAGKRVHLKVLILVSVVDRFLKICGSREVLHIVFDSSLSWPAPGSCSRECLLKELTIVSVWE